MRHRILLILALLLAACAPPLPQARSSPTAPAAASPAPTAAPFHRCSSPRRAALINAI